MRHMNSLGEPVDSHDYGPMDIETAMYQPETSAQSPLEFEDMSYGQEYNPVVDGGMEYAAPQPLGSEGPMMGGQPMPGMMGPMGEGAAFTGAEGMPTDVQEMFKEMLAQRANERAKASETFQKQAEKLNSGELSMGGQLGGFGLGRGY